MGGHVIAGWASMRAGQDYLPFGRKLTLLTGDIC